MTEAQIVQSVRAAYSAQSMDLNQPFGNEEVSVVGQSRLIAQVALSDLKTAQQWVINLGPVTTPGQQGARAGGTGGGASFGVNPQLLSDTFCVVEWGMGGSEQWAVVDWTYGQQFTVYGSFVRVFAGITAFGTAGSPPNPRTRFAGHIVPGFSSKPAVRTILYPQVTAALERSLALPAYADRFHISGLVDSTDLEFLQLEGRLLVGGTPIWRAFPGIMSIDTIGPNEQTDPNFMARSYPIPMGTTFLAILMTGAVGVFAGRVRYTLGLS